MKITIDTKLPTLNEYINLERTNKFMAAKLKKDTTNAVAWLVSKHKLPKDTLFDVHFTWFKLNNRADHDNIAFAKKFVLDGLVKGGVLGNDSPKFINNFTDTFVLDKSRKYISCEVEFKEI